MNTLEIKDGQLHIQVHGLHQVFALRSEFSIPLTHITGARRATKEDTEKFALRVFGAALPKVGDVGYFWFPKEGLSYIDAGDSYENVIVVDLQDERLKHLFIEVVGKTPDEAIAMIEQARQVTGLCCENSIAARANLRRRPFSPAARFTFSSIGAAIARARFAPSIKMSSTVSGSFSSCFRRSLASSKVRWKSSSNCIL